MMILAFPSDVSRYGAIEEKAARATGGMRLKDQNSRSVRVQALPSEPKTLVIIIW